MASKIALSLLCLSLVALAAISFVALQHTHELHKRIVALEKNQTHQQAAQEAHQKAQEQTRQNHHRKNIFFAGVDQRVVLDKPILGERLFMDLDEYDVVHPAVLAKGAVVVQGSGRLILDGDASDLILKIDNEYFSLRQLFGIGKGIDPTPRYSAVELDTSSPERYNFLPTLCGGTEITVRGGLASCPLRRNFGVDSCLVRNGPTTCYCGGGYEPLGSTIRLRHFICEENIDCERIFIHDIAPYCCAPQAEITDYACKDAWERNLFNTNENSTQFYLIDRYTSCSVDVSGTLCQNVDRNDYIRAYGVAGIDNNVLNQNDTLVEIRKILNTHAWGITRDLVLDDGRAYTIQLKNDVYNDCTQPRLRLLHTHALPSAFYAAWTCVLDLASEIYFSKSTDQSFESNQWGALYYVLVKESTHKKWYCLSKPVDEWPEPTRISIVGQSTSFENKQVVFVDAKNQELCATLYFGNRDFGEYKDIDGIGFSELESDRFVVNQGTLSPVAILLL